MPAAGQYFPFANLTELDGLPSSTVFSVVQDDDGLMWFATRGGVVAYDGVDWFPCIPLDNGAHRVFTHLAKDSRGHIWAATARTPVKIAYQQGDQWLALPPLALPGNGWQITDFVIGDGPDGRPVPAVFSARGYLRVWDGERWREVAPRESFRYIHTLVPHQGALLIASDKGVKRLDLATWELQEDPLPGVPELPLLTLATRGGQDDPIYLVGQDWIGRHQDGHFEMLAENRSFPLKQATGPVFSLVDRTGDLFFGDLSRTYIFSPTRRDLLPVRRAHSRIASGSTGIVEDREGFIWFAGMRGVDKLITRKFTNYDDQHGLFQDEVSSILHSDSGRIILGHEEGLTFFEPDRSTLKLDFPPNTRSRVFALVDGPDGHVWLAADQLGVGRLDPDGTIRWWNQEHGLAGGVFSIQFDGEGRLWAGTQNGLFRMRGDRFERLHLPDHSPKGTTLVRRVLAGPSGEILAVAANEGVYRYLQDEGELWIPRQGPELNFYSVAIRDDGEVWLATSKGLYRASPTGVPEKILAPGPEISRPIYSILKGRDGQYWFGTDAGVVSWDGSELQAYTAKDGLLGSDTNRDALKMDASGRIWIGTERGLSIFNPAYNLPPAAPPIMEFMGFEAGGQALAADAPGRLETPPHTLFASFRGISLADRRSLGISTWLEGFESGWQRPAEWSTHEVRYHNLPPGTYRFHARAVLASGKAGPEIVSPALVIAKPFWSRWWFLLLCLGGALLLAWILFTWLASRRYTWRLEKEVQLRTADLARSEEAVRTESERFAATVNGVSEGVLTLDGGGRVVLCNPSAQLILGRCQADLLGLTQDLILGNNALLPGEFSRAFALTRPDGHQVWLEGTAAPVKGPGGQPAGQVVVLRDVTEKLQREDDLARAQKLESLGLLAGGLAHDFNNLLTVILGNIELAQENGPLAEPARNFLATSRQATFRAKSLTDQLLTFARGGAPQLAASSPAEIIEQAAALAFSGSAHTVKFDLEENLWAVRADSGQMVQVFSNLFLNACQAMPRGGAVTVTARNRPLAGDGPDQGAGVLVEVRDEGTGIAPEHHSKIFDPYFTTKDSGTGLGLATAYSIVHRHGGALGFETSPDQGSTFRVFLPRAHEEIRTAPAVAALPFPRGRRVLVMDDEEPIRDLVLAMLERMGVETVLTADGAEAVAAFEEARRQERPFAAALLDLTVPGGMGGRQTAAELLSLAPDFRIALMTGYSTEGIQADHRRYGFVAAMAKPFVYTDLEVVMGILLGNR